MLIFSFRLLQLPESSTQCFPFRLEVVVVMVAEVICFFTSIMPAPSWRIRTWNVLRLFTHRKQCSKPLSTLVISYKIFIYWCWKTFQAARSYIYVICFHLMPAGFRKTYSMEYLLMLPYIMFFFHFPPQWNLLDCMAGR